MLKPKKVEFINAIGGTVTIDGNLKRHVINLGDTFQVLTGENLPMRVLEQPAGGGGGGLGGGAGGEPKETIYLSKIQTYTLTVGLGGLGSTAGFGPNSRGQNGGNTIFDGSTTLGGGGGGGFDNTEMNGNNGSNGGGAGCELAPNYFSGAVGTGFKNGGLADNTGSATGGGGGGAHSANGSNGAVNTGGNGADGFQSNILGQNQYFGGAGGGGGYSTRGLGGAGGGGRGALNGGGNLPGNFYGAGGGGGYGTVGSPGANGVIIVEYPFDNALNLQPVVFGWQSNGTNRFNKTGNLPTFLQGVQSYGVYYKATDNSSDNGSWQQAEAGVNTQTGTPQTGKFGMDLSMSYKLRNTYNTKVFLFPTAISSTYIANDVNPSHHPSHVGQYYDRMMNDHYLIGVSKLYSFTKSPILVLIGGESDSDTLAHGMAAQANVTAYVAKFRLDTGYPNAKVIMLAPRTDYGGPSLGLSALLTGMANIAGSDSNFHLIDMNTALTPYSVDGQHQTPTVDNYVGVMGAINAGYLIADKIATFL